MFTAIFPLEERFPRFSLNKTVEWFRFLSNHLHLYTVAHSKGRVMLVLIMLSKLVLFTNVRTY